MLNRPLPKAIVVGIFNLWTTVAAAGSCPGQMYSASHEVVPPTSVNVADISAFVAAAPWSEGVRMSVNQNGEEVWLDVTQFPGEVTAAAATRIAWLVGRVMKTDANSIVFADNGKGVFQIKAGVLKDIGCRFVIGEQGGENPIALMRQFYDALAYYDTKARVAPRFTGSLLGDTTAAMTTNNEVFLPKWVLSAVK